MAVWAGSPSACWAPSSPATPWSSRGEVESTEVDEVGAGFVTVGVTLSVEGDVKTTCRGADRTAPLL